MTEPTTQPPGSQARFQKGTPLSQLGPEEPLDWMWEGYLARERITLLTGICKGGKTTLLAHLFKAMSKDGHFCGQKVKAGKVLVISEEHPSDWIQRNKKIGIGDHVHVYCLPFTSGATIEEWREFMLHLARETREENYSLIVFDTLISVNPVLDENDASKTRKALTMLRVVAAAGAAILLVHHPKKTPTSDILSPRGTGDLPALADIPITMRSVKGAGAQSTRRVLRSVSRYEETPRELVIEYVDGTYQAYGTISGASQAARIRVMSDILSNTCARPNTKGMTRAQIRSAWTNQEIPLPGGRTFDKDLLRGIGAKKWVKIGTGNRGDPCVYCVVRTSYS